MAFAIGVVAGCGRIAFDPRVDGIDAAFTDATPCTFGPWGPIQQLTALGTPSLEWGPGLSPDGLELAFDSDRTGDHNLYLATWSEQTQQFESPIELTILNSARNEGSPVFSPDGMTLYFGSDRITAGVPELYAATRSGPGATFGAPQPVPELAGMFVGGATLSSDARELLYSNGNADFVGCVKTTSTFDSCALHSELGKGGYPSLSGDDLTIYFVAARPGPAIEIFTATRPTPAMPFGPATRVEEFAGQSDDPEISRDGHLFVFASNRLGGYELFMSTRSCM